jgi:hypothetical protein
MDGFTSHKVEPSEVVILLPVFLHEFSNLLFRRTGTNIHDVWQQGPEENFGHKRQEVTGDGENCIIRIFMSFTLHETLLERSNQGGWKWLGMLHAWESEEMHITFQSKSPGKRLIHRPRQRWEDNIKINLKCSFLRLDCIHLAQVRIQWRGLMNTVRDLLVE